MTPEEWNKAKKLFDAALLVEPSQRAAFLAENCPDSLVRQEVERLLINFQEAGSFLSNPALDPHTPESGRISEPPSEDESSSLKAESGAFRWTTMGTDDPMVGRHLGAYKLERRVGQGGMAAVFLAARADGEFRQQVAIKLVLPGSERNEILNRFRSERQTLAGLDHPNIVKLLDGGSTAEGLPYLVMDYVEGSPIDQYCDNRRLSIEHRLRMFVKVCEAVQHAHRKRIIHRDLKPGNILVTADGVPKLLDFGIAKVLEPAALPVLTQTGVRCMTPAYASPEQVRGRAVTTASDIYSLGVVLYELLTGHRPYRLKGATASEIERAICEQEPENPSMAVNRVDSVTLSNGTTVTKTPDLVSRTREGQPDRLRRRLRGDLDNIVLKALQKDPERRYNSVEEFGQDIERHLRHLPVKARRSTLAYRSSRLVRRHKIAAGVASVLVLALATTAWLVLGLRDRSTASSSIRSLAKRVPGRLTKESQSAAIQPKPVNLTALDAYLQGNYLLEKAGEGGARDKVMGQAGEYFQKAIDADPGFARAYVGRSYAHNLWRATEEDFNIMKNSAEKAIELDPTSADAWKALGDVKLDDWDWRGCIEEYRRAIALDPKNASAHSSLGNALDMIGDMGEGWKEAQIAQQLDPNQDHLSGALYLRGQYDNAIALLKRMTEAHPDAINHWNLWEAYAQKGMYADSMRELSKSMAGWLPDLARHVQGAFATSGWRGALKQLAREVEQGNAYVPGILAQVYARLGDKDRAFYWLEEGRVHRHLALADPVIVNIKVDPSFAALQSDPRFHRFLRRAGLLP